MLALRFHVMMFGLLGAVALGACREGSARGGTMPGRPLGTPPAAVNAAPRDVVPAPMPLASGFQRGVNHAHIHSRGHGYGSAVSAAAMDSLRRLGVNSIAITPFAFQRGATADKLFGFPGDGSSRRDGSMTFDDIIAETRAAHERGISVVLKPHIWSNDFWDGTQWHGSVSQGTPEEHARWWACYRAFAMHYARVADTAGVDTYCIGTELVLMSTRYPDEWRALARDIRRVYHGKLAYAAHWEHEFDSIAFWDALDYVGVNAYFPLKLPDTATVEQLVAAWAPHRERIQRLVDRVRLPVLFLEAGYRPVSGAFREPWRYDGGTSDPQTQARAYEALFRAFCREPWWQGLYLWKTFTDPAMASEYGEDMSFCFQGRPAEAVVRAWYGGH